MMPRRLRITGVVAAACAAVAALIAVLGGGAEDRSAAATSGAAAVPNAKAADEAPPAPLKSRPKIAVALPPGEAQLFYASSSTGAASHLHYFDARRSSE